MERPKETAKIPLLPKVDKPVRLDQFYLLAGVGEATFVRMVRSGVLVIEMDEKRVLSAKEANRVIKKVESLRKAGVWPGKRRKPLPVSI